MAEQDRPSNWALATAAFRDAFLTAAPVRAVWHGKKHWIDDVPVSEDVFLLACGGHLAAARALWLVQVG